LSAAGYWRARARVAVRARRRRLAARLGRAPASATGPAPFVFADLLALVREGPRPLDGTAARRRDAPVLRVAVVIPPFRRGSGGHATAVRLAGELRACGHDVAFWLHDPGGRMRDEPGPVAARKLHEFFPFAPGAPLHPSLAAFDGADVALATAWETVPAVCRLDGCAARAYLVQDHEPEFLPTSAERLWAEQTYRAGLHAICAGPWLAGLLRERYGASASSFDLGIDHAVYAPRDSPAQEPGTAPPANLVRESGTVAFYARAVTPRRAVPLGVLALAELLARRPQIRVVTFGDERAPAAPFPVEHLGVATPERLADLYRRATAGLCLSLTNHSLVPGEMLASGLSCVELAGASGEAVFGAAGPVALAAPDPLAIAGALERLLSDPAERARRAEAGRAWAAGRTWAAAASQVEEGLRAALSRSSGPASPAG
jgi:glycosyltransferase involved in cell wall biosynthesis